ncbi:BREX-1 system adenine-specific DNA-methyltransferase PglX [Brachybacterium alimentarium]|uniref:BREX-1 system adenine-specific DNA-methyltransferase PglX n=1 Tax=Brachybacterium alimentarium TaxID=47845 RepID=UPI000DF40AE9|nr:BREX-1 system adenine-specific DNA-methyltransferase PglX [Brachybacterium alimentarium]RCS84827.1 BREX-1 system adenine-specific DNA-methyltransferase PglX [Brachybacterium alimentarium]
MDTAALKSFATSARTELIREVGARITAVLAHGSPERIEQPRTVASLKQAISAGGGGDKGKAHVADKVAYTWFNRIVALRFMDANGYTGIGVVSPAADQVGQPEVLAAAKRGQVDGDVVKGSNAATITGLLNGTRQPRPGVDAQAEAYALLLADYCRYWNRAMPFMFEREGDYTELLIPANLLADDSALSRSVKVLTEEVCQDVEVIGWLYQFYISERKDEVFAGFKKNQKAGADEIPAATQLFTPHWIVRYLVENSLGRLWMLNHPQSRLVDQMDYYIAPVDEETDFLKITKPEQLTVIDPACGSGHMLTYAFDLLYAIYEEEGYAPSEIPGLILANNLYGTEIDPRAGALSAFSLTMKAAARRKLFLKNPVEPNVCAIEPVSFGPDELKFLVAAGGDRHAEETFWNLFAEADTRGALIQPTTNVTAKVANHLDTLDDGGDLLHADTILWAKKVIKQALYLSPRYAVVVANPPYAGLGNLTGALSDWAKKTYPVTKTDLYSMFIERALRLVTPRGLVAMVTMQSWMSLRYFEGLRTEILDSQRLVSMAHLGPRAFGSIGGEVVGTTAFVVSRQVAAPGTRGQFLRLVEGRSEAAKARSLREIASGSANNYYVLDLVHLLRVPGKAFVYWATDRDFELFATADPVGDHIETRVGLITGDNDSFLRRWHEVSLTSIEFDASRDRTSNKRWFPYVKGGGYRRWAGNYEFVVNWYNDGSEVKANVDAATGRVRAHNFNGDFAFREGFTWSGISGNGFAVRDVPRGFKFDTKGPMGFPMKLEELRQLQGLLNSAVAVRFMRMLAPTLDFNLGHVMSIPFLDALPPEFASWAEECVQLAWRDWDQRETSWGFKGSPLVRPGSAAPVNERLDQHIQASRELVSRMHELETTLNAGALEAYGLLDVQDVSVEPDEITLDAARATDTDFARSAIEDLVSYAVGCMFGRYSLDGPGLILANYGETFQDYLARVASPTFTPDADNVIPVVDGDWFEDDILERFRQFLRAAFGEQYFEENLRFVTESLGVKNLRGYFVKAFYKDHVQRYKRRPIYWLFSSPKGSFNALIYMHRYTPSTVSTVLTYLREYVTKLESALQQAERGGNAKEADRLRKILVELNEYEHDTLFPKASENVVIDLDDGVKANYPKFGAALKKIPGLGGGE